MSALIDLKDHWRKRDDNHGDDRDDRSGVPALHQSHARASLGRHHQAGVREAVLPRRDRRIDLRGRLEGALVVARSRELWTDNTVLEFDPPRRYVHSWVSLYDPETAKEEESRSWEIDPTDAGYCKLTVVHDKLEGAQDRGQRRWRLDVHPQRPQDALRNRKAARLK